MIKSANCKSVRLICRHHGVLSQVRILPIYSQFIFRISEFACWCWMSRCGIFRGNFEGRQFYGGRKGRTGLCKDGTAAGRPLERLRRPLVLAKVPIKGHWNIMEAVWKQNKAWTRLLHGNGQPHPNLVRPKTNREDSAPKTKTNMQNFSIFLFYKIRQTINNERQSMSFWFL